MYKIFSSSPQAILSCKKDIGLSKYPWDKLQAGQSFIVPYKDVLFKSLRSQASVAGKRLGCKFRVIDHGEETGYEVALIKVWAAKEPDPAPVPASYWQATLDKKD